MPRSPLSLHHPEDWPPLLNTEQVGGLLGFGREAVIAMLDRGELRGTRIGHPWRIAAEAIWPLVPPEIRETWPPGPWRRPAGVLTLTRKRQKPGGARAVRVDGELLDELDDAAAHLAIPLDELLKQAIRDHLAALRQERDLGDRFPHRQDE